jgi:bifunctional hydroxylase/dehydrase
MVLPLGPDARRVVVHERTTGLRGTRAAPTFGEVAAAFQRLTGEDIHGGKPLWVSWFTDSSRQAAEYRRGRVLLAGDAAHVHMPIGGQGISAGVGDAVNLGWKLAAELGRPGRVPGLLDTYHTERHPVGARVITNTLAQRTLYLSGDQMRPLREVFAELVDFPEARRHLVGMVTGLDIRYEVGPGDHPLLGRRVPNHALVGRDGTKTSVFGQLHGGRAVLLDCADDAGLRTAADGWVDRVDVVTARPHEAEGGVFDGVRGVLVRPDGYVAWIATDDGAAVDLPAALGRWFGEPVE